jgi:hypothetical protein
MKYSVGFSGWQRRLRLDRCGAESTASDGGSSACRAESAASKILNGVDCSARGERERKIKL